MKKSKKYLKSKINFKILRKKSRKKELNLTDIANKILSDTSEYNLKENELESIIFYRLLIVSQTTQIPIYQDKPFEYLYI